jgi:hypothetical protein
MSATFDINSFLCEALQIEKPPVQAVIKPPVPVKVQPRNEDFMKLTLRCLKKRRLESESIEKPIVQASPAPRKKRPLLQLLLEPPTQKKQKLIVLKPAVTSKSKWTREEDEELKSLMEKTNVKSYSQICGLLTTPRTSKQCRERWHNHLNPEVKKDKWTPEEDALICASFNDFGPSWSRMALLMKGRTDNAIKNHFNSTLKRKNAASLVKS